MSAIFDVDLAIFCGRIGCLYTRGGLSPPFALRSAAEGWIATGIPINHCVDMIERYLSRHASTCYSGSGDRDFAWLNSLIQISWYERQAPLPMAQSKRPKMQRVANPPQMDRQPSADHKVDRGPSPGTREVTPGNRSDAPGCTRADGARPRTAEPTDLNRKRPNQIDRAITFLRCELANGEVAATHLEEKAKAKGISTRTLDRARARLNVISRRTGFAKEGKCWCSLPTTP